MLRSNRRLLHSSTRYLIKCSVTIPGQDPNIRVTSVQEQKGLPSTASKLRDETDKMQQQLGKTEQLHDKLRQDTASLEAKLKVMEVHADFAASVMTNLVLWQLSDDLREVVYNKVFSLSHKKFTWKSYTKWLHKPNESNEQTVPFAHLLMTPLCEPGDKERITWGMLRHTGKYNPEPSTPSPKDKAFAVWRTRTGEHMLSYDEALLVLKVLDQEKALKLAVSFSSKYPEP
ncbi:hypothetical protein ABBQ38_007772 [Trebouxia sp. C0009 RCD-2024]